MPLHLIVTSNNTVQHFVIRMDISAHGGKLYTVCFCLEIEVFSVLCCWDVEVFSVLCCWDVEVCRCTTLLGCFIQMDISVLEDRFSVLVVW